MFIPLALCAASFSWFWQAILQGTVKGGSRQGRQKKRWEDNIREWTGLEFGKSQRAVENREEWRKLVVKSPVVPQQPPQKRDRWRWRWRRSITVVSGCTRTGQFSSSWHPHAGENPYMLHPISQKLPQSFYQNSLYHRTQSLSAKTHCAV